MISQSAQVVEEMNVFLSNQSYDFFIWWMIKQVGKI